MFHPVHKIGLAVIACGLLIWPNITLGQKAKPRKVQDELKLFSAVAVDDANAVIAKIKEVHGKDLLIETREKGVPVKGASKWAIDQANSHSVDGVYVIITKQPMHFEVVLTKATRESGQFTIADRDELVKILKANLGKASDDALLKVANYTLDKMNSRMKTPVAFQPLVGEWLGPVVEVTVTSEKGDAIRERKVKGQLYLRFSEIRNTAFLDLGYYVPGDKGDAISLFRNYSFHLKEGEQGKQILVRTAISKDAVALTYQITDDQLTIKTAETLSVPGLEEPVDPSGAWKRLVRK